MNRRLRLGVLGSGRGTNALALASACASGKIPATIDLVLSDVSDCGLLERARALGLPSEYIAPGPFRTKLDDAAESALVERLRAAEVDYVVLAGFMRILKDGFLRSFPQRVLNIHPSLLPAFPGLQAWRQALDHGVKITGCTVHVVDHGIDSGPILGQVAVPVLDGDTAERLHARIQEAEHRLYPAVIAALARGDLRIEGRRSTGFIGLESFS